MHIQRTRFGKDIVAEFLAPRRSSQKAVLLLSGMPSVPKQPDIMEWFSRRGFWVFLPRYRGTWESSGRFLRRSPEKDVLDVLDGLSKSFQSLWDGSRFNLRIKQLFLIGGSFGGPAAILASRDQRVLKAVAFSPVIDWTAPSKEEPLDRLEIYVRHAFGEAYRFSRDDWKKLRLGNFYSPLRSAKTIVGRKLLLVHAKDDAVVPWEPTANLAAITGSHLTLVSHGGHFSMKALLVPSIRRRVMDFLRR